MVISCRCFNEVFLNSLKALVAFAGRARASASETSGRVKMGLLVLGEMVVRFSVSIMSLVEFYYEHKASIIKLKICGSLVGARNNGDASTVSTNVRVTTDGKYQIFENRQTCHSCQNGLNTSIQSEL